MPLTSIAGRNRLAVMASIVLSVLPVIPAAADKLDDIKARGRLLVGVTESSPPFSFRKPGDGIVGYDVDLAERVAKASKSRPTKFRSSMRSASRHCSRIASTLSPWA